MWELLEHIHCPAIVVRGTRSNILAPETARRMVEVLPEGRLLELDSGHNVQLERPRELAGGALTSAVAPAPTRAGSRSLRRAA